MGCYGTAVYGLFVLCGSNASVAMRHGVSDVCRLFPGGRPTRHRWLRASPALPLNPPPLAGLFHRARMKPRFDPGRSHFPALPLRMIDGLWS
jgi:hypothetical protein